MNTTTTTATTVTADELIHKLTIAAVEIYILGAEAGEGEVCLFKEAIPLIEYAWELSDEQAAEAIELIEKQYEAVRAADQSGADMNSVLDEKFLLDTPCDHEILAVIWGLIETAVRLDRLEDREIIAGLISYLKDFWDFTEHIGF